MAKAQRARAARARGPPGLGAPARRGDAGGATRPCGQGRGRAGQLEVIPAVPPRPALVVSHAGLPSRAETIPVYRPVPG